MSAAEHPAERPDEAAGNQTVDLLPGGGVRADQQLRRDRRRAAPPRPPGRLHRRGVLRGHARGAGIRGAADAADAAAGDRGSPGPVLEGLHPRHRAGLPQADDRAARRSSSPPTFEALVDGARYVDERLLEIIDELRPDVIVEDNVVSFPALLASGRPWARIVSCNPAEIKDPEVPPVFSGCPPTTAAAGSEFRARYRDASPRAARVASSEFCRERGAPPLPPLDFIHEIARPQPLPLSATRSTTARARPLGADLAQPRVQRARAPTRPGSCPPRSRSGERRRWSTSASARSARPTSS